MSALDTLAGRARAASGRRKLEPALIGQRLRGGAKRGPTAPPDAQPGERTTAVRSGPNPFVVVGAALVLGVAAAKLIAWRGHAGRRR